MTPIQIISAIRLGIINSGNRFQSGGCFQLYRILKSLFPEAVALYDGNHVYTQIGNVAYDINGDHEIKPHWNRLEDDPMIFAKAHEWDFQ